MCNSKEKKIKKNIYICENHTHKKGKQFSIDAVCVFGFCSIIVGNLNL